MFLSVMVTYNSLRRGAWDIKTYGIICALYQTTLSFNTRPFFAYDWILYFPGPGKWNDAICHDCDEDQDMISADVVASGA